MGHFLSLGKHIFEKMVCSCFYVFDVYGISNLSLEFLCLQTVIWLSVRGLKIFVLLVYVVSKHTIYIINSTA